MYIVPLRRLANMYTQGCFMIVLCYESIHDNTTER
jgi:hypothetical protein